MVDDASSNDSPDRLGRSRSLRFRADLHAIKGHVSSNVRAVTRGYLSPQGRIERRQIQRWKGFHEGERCVIMGNGPSLNRTDLTLLEGETVFGLNRIYLMFDRLNFRPAYHVAVNSLVVEQCADELNQLDIPFFTTYQNRQNVDRGNAYFLNQLRSQRFHRNISHGIWEGMTVTYVAMQIAFYMGFSDVVLIGVDHSFTTQGRAHKTVTSEGHDPNHFDPTYFGKGFRWQLPDLEGSELAYRLARRAYEADGRRIVDATVGGNLDVFAKEELEHALGRGRTG